MTEAVASRMNVARRSAARLISLGGCGTYEIAKCAENESIKHNEHLWRRPTIALMSNRAKSESTPHIFSADYARYLHDDFNKAHLDQLLAFDADVVLVDVARDIWSGVMRVDDTSFVMDPYTGMHFVGGHPPGAYNDEISEEFHRGRSIIDFKSENFLEIWKIYIDLFLSRISENSDKIVFNRIFFSDQRATQKYPRRIGGRFATIASDDFPYINGLLEEMYDHVAVHSSVRVNAVSRNLLLTGNDVPWNGPFPTHYVGETIALFAENLRQIVLGRTYSQGAKFIKAAFDRAERFEDLAGDLKEVQANAASLAAEKNAIAEERIQLQAAFEQATIERDAIRDSHGSAIAKQIQLQVERDQLQAIIDKAARERDAARTDCVTMAAEQSRLAIKGEQLHAAIAQATIDRQALREECDLLAAEHARSIAVHEQLQVSFAQASTERDAARTERDAAVAEQARLASEGTQLREALQQAAAERDSVRLEQHRAISELRSSLHHGSNANQKRKRRLFATLLGNSNS